MRFKLSLLLLLIIIVIIIQFLSVWHRVIFLVTNKIKMMGLGLHCDKSRCLFIHEKCQLNKIKFSNMRPGGERDRKGKAFIDLSSTKTSFIQSLLHIHLYIHLLTPSPPKLLPGAQSLPNAQPCYHSLIYRADVSRFVGVPPVTWRWCLRDWRIRIRVFAPPDGAEAGIAVLRERDRKWLHCPHRVWRRMRVPSFSSTRKFFLNYDISEGNNKNTKKSKFCTFVNKVKIET